MELEYDRVLVYTNRGQLLLRVQNLGPEVWVSLADFSRQRRSVDGWHYDIAAFTSERKDVCDGLSTKTAPLITIR
jgi:hypothetical protein